MYITDDDPLTKEILSECATKAWGDAAKEAMKIAGSVVTVKDGWLVRIYKSGKTIKIKRIK